MSPHDNPYHPPSASVECDDTKPSPSEGSSIGCAFFFTCTLILGILGCRLAIVWYDIDNALTCSLLLLVSAIAVGISVAVLPGQIRGSFPKRTSAVPRRRNRK